MMMEPTVLADVRPEATRPKVLLGNSPLTPLFSPPVELRSPVEMMLALASAVGVLAPDPDGPLELNGFVGDERTLGDRRSDDALNAELLV